MSGVARTGHPERTTGGYRKGVDAPTHAPRNLEGSSGSRVSARHKPGRSFRRIPLRLSPLPFEFLLTRLSYDGIRGEVERDVLRNRRRADLHRPFPGGGEDEMVADDKADILTEVSQRKQGVAKRHIAQTDGNHRLVGSRIHHDVHSDIDMSLNSMLTGWFSAC